MPSAIQLQAKQSRRVCVDRTLVIRQNNWLYDCLGSSYGFSFSRTKYGTGMGGASHEAIHPRGTVLIPTATPSKCCVLHFLPVPLGL